MTPPLAGIASWYQEGIVDTGREAEFLFLVAFLCTFGFIRISTHMIRAEVSWWPGNVEMGGTHIHHLVFGILILLIVGWVGVVLRPDSPWHETLSVLFGIGTGLTLDEFALWLHLRDVYWSEEGRSSIDAVVVAAAIAGIALVGAGGWVDAATTVGDDVITAVGSAGLIGFGFVLTNVAKEKFGMAVIGLFVPPLALVGAFRLGKPHSAWAHLFYRRADKRERAERRFQGARARPFWRRGAELAGRLRLRVAGSARD